MNAPIYEKSNWVYFGKSFIDGDQNGYFYYDTAEDIFFYGFYVGFNRARDDAWNKANTYFKIIYQWKNVEKMLYEIIEYFKRFYENDGKVKSIFKQTEIEVLNNIIAYK
jgi:hypothetical protein